MKRDTLCKIVFIGWLGLTTIGGIGINKIIDTRLYSNNISQIQKLDQKYDSNRIERLQKQNEILKGDYFRMLVGGLAGGLIGLISGSGVCVPSSNSETEVSDNYYESNDEDYKSDRWQGGYGGFPG